MPKFVIEFDEGPASFYAGEAPDGSLGWAPTPRTAFHFDTREAAELMMRNGYGKLAEIGKVIEIKRVGLNTLCECGHRYDLHAIGESECVRYTKGVRCECREFVAVEK